MEGATRPTVAVKVTGWPVTEGLTDEVRVVVVAALEPVSVKALEHARDEIAVTFVAGLITRDPADNTLVVSVAWPHRAQRHRTQRGQAIEEAHHAGRNPCAGATTRTVAVKVTARPKTAGLGEAVTAVVLTAG